MNFQEYLSQAWSLHATEPAKVMAEFKSHINLIESENDVLGMANLVVHVSGEHLGKWQEGVTLIAELKNHAKLSDTNLLNRSIAILNLGANPDYKISDFNHSDQARIYAVASSAMVSHKDLKRAAFYLKAAEEIAVKNLSKDDPANKSLGITGWNLACELEEKSELNEEEIHLMKQSAHISRKFWELAGDWRDVEQCEYRLASTYLKAGDLSEALKHANVCLKIVGENGNEPYEVFYGQEVLAKILHAQKDTNGFDQARANLLKTFELLSESEKSQCLPSLEKIRAR